MDNCFSRSDASKKIYNFKIVKYKKKIIIENESKKLKVKKNNKYSHLNLKITI